MIKFIVTQKKTWSGSNSEIMQSPEQILTLDPHPGPSTASVFVKISLYAEDRGLQVPMTLEHDKIVGTQFCDTLSHKQKNSHGEELVITEHNFFGIHCTGKDVFLDQCTHLCHHGICNEGHVFVLPRCVRGTENVSSCPDVSKVRRTFMYLKEILLQ